MIDQRILRSSSSKNYSLGVTYLNSKLTDGAGAQLQRIYGVYAISRLLNLQYVHSPLCRVDNQGLAALENKTQDKQLIHRYNELFAIPSDIDPPENCVVREFEYFNLRIYDKLRQEAEARQAFILAKILMPYVITDSYPRSYNYVNAISPFFRDSSPVIRIAVHVRRGDLAATAAERILPNSYYINVALRISSTLDLLGVDYVFELHTELPDKAFLDKCEHVIADGLSEPFMFDPSADRLEEFEQIPNLEKFINRDPIETIRKMATADVLVISRSSFSYLAALLNRNGIIIYHDFWHSMLEDWVRADTSGQFSAREFTDKLNEKITCQLWHSNS